MGQKVNPIGMRIGIIRSWDSKWFASKKDVPALIKEDFEIRKYLNKVYKNAAVSQIEIERLKGKVKDKVKITLHTAKPGFVIGRDAEAKKKAVIGLEKLTNKEIVLNVIEVKRPEKVAVLVAQNIASQLENRASFRRVQKIAIQRALKAGAKGCKTLISGRLGGAEMARNEGYSEGRVPLHTFRADIDYAAAEANTTYGKLGIKVWIYNGDVLPGQTREGNIQKHDDKFARKDNNRKPPRNDKPRPPRTDANKGGR